MNTDNKLAQAARKAIPYLRDEGGKYEDDGSNEPLELAREIESLLAAHDAREGERDEPVAAKQITDSGVCASGAIVSDDDERSVSVLDASDQAVRIRATPTILELAKDCGAEIDGGELPDYQTGFPGSAPTVTFDERQLESFIAALAAQPQPSVVVV